MEKINSSIDVDARLFHEDIAGSVAHTQMLMKTNIITNAEGKKIILALGQILESIKKGKVTFDKLGSSKVISDKYRKKVKFVQSGKEEIIVQGELDLGTKSTDFVKIILKPDPDNKQNYIGIGVVFNDTKKHKSENIKLIIQPIN